MYQRLRHNPDYPFKCVSCPQCDKPLKGSAPRGQGGSYPRYHCERGHRSFSVSRDQMNETVEQFLHNVDYDDDYVKVLEEVLVRKLRQRQKDLLIMGFEVGFRINPPPFLQDIPAEIGARFVVGSALEILDYWLTHPEIGTAEEMATMLFKLLYRQAPPSIIDNF